MSNKIACFMFVFLLVINCSKEDDNPASPSFSVPILTTDSVSMVTTISVRCCGTITSDGGSPIITCGVCWCTDQTPTVEDNATNEGTNVGCFTSSITGLSSGTTYYIKAYATNSVGTGYGDVLSFTTKVLETGTVADINGNTYNTVKIGNQWWMAENLKVSHYRNGDLIPNVTSDTQWQNLSTGAYCNYDNTMMHDDSYGKLYNWYAVIDSRNIAPSGWHVPSDGEWQTLVDFLGGSSVAGGIMKESGTVHWTDPNLDATNASGFSALPGGIRYSYGKFFNIGISGSWWSITEYNATYAWEWSIDYNSSEVHRYNNNKRDGYSVRCIKD
jgi:uncharacterized protein (TIGR02145 family)